MTQRLARKLAVLVLLTLPGLASGASYARAQATAPAGSPRVAPPLPVPETPAGHVVIEWLEAFNSGDSASLRAYYRKYNLDRSLENQMARRVATGGFDVVSVEKSEPRHIEFVVKERKSSANAFGVIELKGGDTVGLTISALYPIPPGTSVADFKIDGVTRSRVIDGVVTNLDEFYVFPDVAKKMADALRARQTRGEYDLVTNGISFAWLLTDQLQQVSHDKHLRVDFSPGRMPDAAPGSDPDAEPRYRRAMESLNCGFVRAEQLTGNIGYLKFNFFANPDVCGPTATAAMNFLSNVDGLIIDLRDNGGGDPKMVALVSSYLFSKPTHLNDLWTRKTNTTDQYWTLPYVPGKRLGDDKPVYVLTSKRTFSGAEEFSYNLKNLKRATIVGETTGGGAHPVSGHRIDDHFMIGVPFARAINPTSQTNWEGVGVEPDVKVPAGDALTAAQKLITERRPAK